MSSSFKASCCHLLQALVGYLFRGPVDGRLTNPGRRRAKERRLCYGNSNEHRRSCNVLGHLIPWPTIILLLASQFAWAGGPALTVDAAVDRALRSGEIDSRRQGVEEARGRLQQRRSLPSAVVTYDRQHVYDRNGTPGFVQDLLKLEQPLVAGGLRNSRRLAGVRGIDAAAQAVEVARNKRVLEVRKAFARVLEAQRIVQIYRCSHARLKTAQEVIQARVGAGESSRYEKLRIELAEAQERDLGTAAVVEQVRAIAELAGAMSCSLPANTIVTGTLSGPLFLTVDSADSSQAAATSRKAPASPVLPVDSGPPPTTDAALARRPEIALEASRAAQAAEEERVARAEVRPQLALGLGYLGFDQSGLSSQSGYNAIVSVSLPWADRRRGEIRAAQARLEAAKHSSAATTARIRAEIEGARQNLRAADARLVEILALQASKVIEMVSVAETSHRAGVHSLLELLDAYRLERDFQVSLFRAQGALQQAIEEYCHAVGASPAEIVSRSQHVRSR